MTRATDWDSYYRSTAATARFTRPILIGRVVEQLARYLPQHPTLAELGGSGSCIFDSIEARLHPVEYHVIDTNQLGLDALQQRSGGNPALRCWNRNVLELDLPLQLDGVLSLGLIEHFDPAGTRAAVAAHLRLLKPGGIAAITFPTPTWLYRASRRAIEIAGKWIFHDERPLREAEVRAALGPGTEVLHGEIVWPIVLTQTILVVRKRET